MRFILEQKSKIWISLTDESSGKFGPIGIFKVISYAYLICRGQSPVEHVPRSISTKLCDDTIDFNSPWLTAQKLYYPVNNVWVTIISTYNLVRVEIVGLNEVKRIHFNKVCTFVKPVQPMMVIFSEGHSGFIHLLMGELVRPNRWLQGNR